MFKIICLLTFIFSGAVYSNGAAAHQGSAHSTVSENANSPDPNDLSQQLIEAIRSGSFAEVQHLIEVSGVSNSSRKLFWYAVVYGRFDVVRFLIDKGADVNASYAAMPLRAAASRGYLDIVQLLVANKAKVNFQGKIGITALMGAATNGHLDVVQFLVANGAYVYLTDKWGNTALTWAATNGHLDVVQFLVANGAKVNVKDKAGRTPLLEATRYNRDLDVIQFLVANEAKVNVKDKEDSTPLLEAARYNRNLDIIQFLVANGAYMNVKDKEGRTPLMYLAEGGY